MYGDSFFDLEAYTPEEFDYADLSLTFCIGLSGYPNFSAHAAILGSVLVGGTPDLSMQFHFLTPMLKGQLCCALFTTCVSL